MHTSGALILCCLILALCSGPAVATAATLHPGDIVVGVNYGLIRIDPTTGDGTVISDDTHGAGAPLVEVQGITWGADGQIYVVDDMRNAVVRVDPVSGDRTVIAQSPLYGSDTRIGNGPAFRYPTAIATESSGALLVVTEDSLLRMNPATGDRTILSSEGVGVGVPGAGGFSYPSFGVAVNSVGDIFVSDYFGNMITKVNPVTGDRSWGNGDLNAGTHSYLTGLASSASGTLYAIGNGFIFAVNEATGRGEWLSGTGYIGYGPGLAGLAIDSTGGLIVGDRSGIHRIDPIAHTKTIVSYQGANSVLIVPIPEPSTWVHALFGFGIVMITFRSRLRIERVGERLTSL